MTEDLRALLAAVTDHQALAEHEFRSALPVIGPVVVYVRRLWHAVAGRWALRTVICQQNMYNALVAEALAALVQACEEQTAHLNSIGQSVDEQVTRLNAIGQSVDEQAARIDRLAEELAFNCAWLQRIDGRLDVHDARLMEVQTSQVAGEHVRQAQAVRLDDHEAWTVAFDREQAVLFHALADTASQLTYWRQTLAERTGTGSDEVDK